MKKRNEQVLEGIWDMSGIMTSFYLQKGLIVKNNTNFLKSFKPESCE